MKIRSISLRLFAVLAVFGISTAAFSYDPSYEEILVKREKIAIFCSKSDNSRKYDICETFRKVRKKLPADTGEEEILKYVHNRMTQ